MSNAFQLFGATVDSSLVDNINIAPQRPVKCFDNLVKKFEFNLIISNPKGSSNVKLSVTLETCTVSVYYFAWYLCYIKNCTWY